MDTRGAEENSTDSLLRAGDHAPDFTLPDCGGGSGSLATHLRTGPVILSFMGGRQADGLDAELHALSACVSRIATIGGTVLAISSVPRPPAGGFHLLHDTRGIVTRRYGLSRLPMAASAIFVIGQDSKIILSLIDAAPGSDLACTNVLGALAALPRIAGAWP